MSKGKLKTKGTLPAKVEYRHVVMRNDGFYWTGKDWVAYAPEAKKYKRLPLFLCSGEFELMVEKSRGKTWIYYQKVGGDEVLTVKRTRVAKE